MRTSHENGAGVHSALLRAWRRVDCACMRTGC